MNIMKNILLIFLLVACYPIFAQEITADSLKGEWICREVILTEAVTDSQMKAIMNMMKKGFVNARFIFRSDGILNFKLAKEAPAEMAELVFLDNKKWKYVPETRMIMIHPQIMDIEVKREAGFLNFLLEETPLMLRMERKKN